MGCGPADGGFETPLPDHTEKDMDEETRFALHRVIEYLWADEKEHYEVCGPDADGHIFEAVDHLARWLDEEEGRI